MVPHINKYIARYGIEFVKVYLDASRGNDSEEKDKYIGKSDRGERGGRNEGWGARAGARRRRGRGRRERED